VNLTIESYDAFTLQVEEELEAFTLQQRMLADIVHGRRGSLDGFLPLVHTQLDKLSVVTYLSLADGRDPYTGRLVCSSTVAQLLGVEDALLRHFERWSRPLSPYGDDVVLYDSENDLRTFFESSLEHAGYYLLGIPLRLNSDFNNKLKLYTLGQIVDYFQCNRIIQQNSVKTVSSLDSISLRSDPFSKEEVTVLVLSADFGREYSSFFHKALNLKEAGISSVQVWQRVSRSREVKFIRELWLSPHIPEKGCCFSFSSPMDRKQEILVPTRRLYGLVLNEFIMCHVDQLLRLLEERDKSNELTREILILKRLHEIGLGQISLGKLVNSLSHGQRELLVLCRLLLTSLTDCAFRVIGDFNRFPPHHLRLLTNLLTQHVGSHNQIEYYTTFGEEPRVKVEVASPVKEEFVIDHVDLPFELTSKRIVLPLDGVTVIEGRSLSGKTTLLKEQLVSIFGQSSFKTLKQRSFSPHYIDLSVVPHFGEEPCGNVVGITEDLALWFAALPESRRRGLTKSDFLSNESLLLDEVKFQGLSFSEIVSMTFGDSFVFFPEGNSLKEEIAFLLEVGFADSTWLRSASHLSLSARKRLHVVKFLLTQRRLFVKKTRKRTHTILLLDEIFSGVPTDLQARFGSMLHRLARRGITIIMSSISPVADDWIDRRWGLTYNEETGRVLISQLSGEETKRYG
jgi:hypothetical protein